MFLNIERENYGRRKLSVKRVSFAGFTFFFLNSFFKYFFLIKSD